ncbi:DUF2793 domain-containing protein [Sphingomonas faeni]|uniref:DUF2793 domain-containing protein n=1 Tax=Sphingomonas faeni TaxID=185950 RepID=UPI0027D81C3E|nr:DUF2793 domain-containing protein [Sphingomonas faeni]
MSDDSTSRLALPLLQPGQAQKETTHNEALTLLDLAVQASVVAVGTNVPPVAPTPGSTWIVGTAPTGGWAEQARAIAGWTSSGWRFLAGREGMTVWSIADGQPARFGAGTWTLGVLAGEQGFDRRGRRRGRTSRSGSGPDGRNRRRRPVESDDWCHIGRVARPRTHFRLKHP